MSIPVHNSVSADPAWAALEKVCRGISFLRASGQPEAAEQMCEADFRAAEAAVRASAGDDPEVERLIQAVRQTEERRADDAQALAELLAPLLAQRLQHGVGAAAGARPANPARPLPAQPARHPSPRGIADFIDEMIAQDHPV